MNKKYLVLSLVLFVTYIISAQDSSVSDKIKNAVDNLFESCKADNLELASKQIAFTGKDEARDMKDTYNISDKKEASKVSRIMKKIAGFIKISDKHEFGDYKLSEENGNKIHSLDVIFKSGEQELKTTFSFVELNGKFLLVDLN